MFECDNQDSCILYVNGGQRNIYEANNHDQTTHDQYNRQPMDCKTLAEFSDVSYSAKVQTLTDIVGV